MKKTIIFLAAALAATALFFSSFSKRATQPLVVGDATFQDFLKQFPSEKLPFALDEKMLQARLELEVTRYNNPDNYSAPKRQRLSWEYFKFLPDLREASRFSRNPLTAEPVAAFQTEQFHAVIYLAGRGFSRNYGTYHVSVFDKKGKHIATNVAGSVSPNTLGSFKLEKNLALISQSWQVNWEKDYGKHGMEDNKIVSLISLETTSLDATKAPRAAEDEEEPQSEEASEADEEGSSR